MVHTGKNVEFEKQIEKMLDSLSQQSSDSMWFSSLMVKKPGDYWARIFYLYL